MPKSFQYVDAFVIPLPKKNLKAYLKIAKMFGKIWKENGAIDYVECIADDVSSGEVTSFPQSVKLKKGEVVIFSWVTHKSKAHRDKAFERVMSDPRLEKLMSPDNMPFDGMRMYWGGFKPIVKLG